ncbi:MAG: NUDIX hydrolase [Sodalinema sp.]|uniref:NUDIX hydrolase n=1 Tax=Sodalinema sp. TaxID=3080550 RepID=UPI00396F38FC
MGKYNSIRVIALGLIRDGDRLFLSEGYDSKKKKDFYRALGGGVEFLETSLTALKREFQEEVEADLTNIKYLDCIENIFEYKGKKGHEIIQLYRCDFVDKTFYERETVPFLEGKRKKVARWVEIEKFRSGELTLYPEGFLRYCETV